MVQHLWASWLNIKMQCCLELLLNYCSFTFEGYCRRTFGIKLITSPLCTMQALLQSRRKNTSSASTHQEAQFWKHSNVIIASHDMLNLDHCSSRQYIGMLPIICRFLYTSFLRNVHTSVHSSFSCSLAHYWHVKTQWWKAQTTTLSWWTGTVCRSMAQTITMNECHKTAGHFIGESVEPVDWIRLGPQEKTYLGRRAR